MKMLGLNQIINYKYEFQKGLNRFAHRCEHVWDYYG